METNNTSAIFRTIESMLHINKGEGYFWCSLFLLEAIIIVALNMFTIIVFTKDRHVRKRSTYLLINLSAADIGVGGLVIPIAVFRRGNTYGLWNVDMTPAWFISTYGVDTLFFGCSLAFLVSISVERLYATRSPMRHRSMTGQAYMIWMSCVWVASFISAAVVVLFLFYDGLQIWYGVASCVFVWLLILTFSYFAIFVTVRCSKQPQHSHRSQARKERRLTMTLFIVTLVSLSVWIPYVLFTFLESHLSRQFSLEALSRARGVCEALFFANSLVNPILYTIRMPQFRRASINLITCSRNFRVGQTASLSPDTKNERITCVGRSARRPTA